MEKERQTHKQRFKKRIKGRVHFKSFATLNFYFHHSFKSTWTTNFIIYHFFIEPFKQAIKNIRKELRDLKLPAKKSIELNRENLSILTLNQNKFMNRAELFKQLNSQNEKLKNILEQIRKQRLIILKYHL